MYKNILTIFASIIFSLLSAEAVLRFWPQEPVDAETERLPDKSQPRRSGYDVVAIGDSHTYGELNGKSWTDFYSEMTGKTILNLGYPGYGFKQYYELMDEALKYNPEKIIIAVYLGNDIYDTYRYVYNIKKSDGNFLRKSALYRFLGDRTRALREKLKLAEPVVTGTDDWSDNRENATLNFPGEPKTQFENRRRLIGMDLETEEVREGLELAKKYLSLIAEKAGDKELLFVLIPTKQSVYSRLVPDNKNFNLVVQNEQEIKRIFSDYNNLDILECLQTVVENKEQIYYNSINDHPNEHGYLKYAEAIVGH